MPCSIKYELRSAMCFMQWDVCTRLCTVHCIVCTGKCDVSTVQYAVCTVQCAQCSVHAALQCAVQCEACALQCAVCALGNHSYPRSAGHGGVTWSNTAILTWSNTPPAAICKARAVQQRLVKCSLVKCSRTARDRKSQLDTICGRIGRSSSEVE